MFKQAYLIVTILMAASISGCVSEKDHKKAQHENQKLKQQVEALKAANQKLTEELNVYKLGEDRIVALIEEFNKNKDYRNARIHIQKLAQTHPQSNANKRFKELLLQIDKKEAAEKKEAERLANINNTGMWRVGYFVDDFGEKTHEAYITNKSIIKGLFSNSATQNSDLNVKFLISAPDRVGIQLYEYAGRNPVKAYSPTKYTILVQDTDKTRLKLEGTNYSERLIISKKDSVKLHKSLMKGGNIQFKIYENKNRLNEYEFTLRNADWYSNAHAKWEGA